ncbi:(S)-ureidoglycine aminohydrolase [Bradyrhizobium sp. CCGUVB1N3]|uniref:(S)-ureidoglycine aminohydrolase n=1 Tax=Bradyrhizobium sp. CCGUVB1N3 TaxID=2949629 RepID=UPI0020B1D3FE|nr:(S)-ureidoglycine aminohydrolase [Bradyrhizobium sp. CCGUVB1N3]MCP3470375.1 (S)-ureidoglycine aminohydrolase [Bradyrhizobium sp. CCGUVB1N3]
MTIPSGRLPPGAFGHTRSVVRRNYAFMPPEGIMDSYLPAYEKTIVRFQAAPALGAKFAQAMLEIEGGGGTRAPISDRLQRFFYVIGGTVLLSVNDAAQIELGPEGYAYMPPHTRFSLRNAGANQAQVIGLWKPYEAIDLPQPDPIVSHRKNVECINHNGTEGRTWEHLLGFNDLRFDMEMNILSFQPGAHFPDVETHIMEHGLYMLEGQGMYLLGADWHETWTSDFIWMGPYCPQLFYPTGWSKAAYLLYKDVNRDVTF